MTNAMRGKMKSGRLWFWSYSDTLIHDREKARHTDDCEPWVVLAQQCDRIRFNSGWLLSMIKILIPLGSITSDPPGTRRFMECDTGHNATTHANSVVWYPDGRIHSQTGRLHSMTTNCQSCRYETTCPGLFQQKQQQKATGCERYAEDTGVLSDRNWV